MIFYVILESERLEMIYLMLMSFLLSIDPSYAQKDIANIVMIRGHEAYIYSGGKKVPVDSKKLPIQLHLGDEIQLGPDTDCELVFNNNDTMYAGAESLFSVDAYKDNMNYVWLKYGVLLYRGRASAIVRATDLFVTSNNGDFIVRYKRSNLEATVLNVGPDIIVKQGETAKPYMLRNNRFIKLTSFKKDGKVYGSIDKQKMPLIYETFRLTFTPNEKEGDNLSAGTTKDIIPTAVDGANLDYIKRTIGP